MNNFDMTSYMSVFLDELDEQLQILDEKVLELEQDSNNLDTIQSIFRAAHTLKGSSAAMGFEKMKELTHKIENVFDLIRNNQLSVSTQTINVIFESIDFIKEFKNGMINGTMEELEITQIVTKLENCKKDSDDVLANSSEPKEQNDSKQAVESSQKQYTFLNQDEELTVKSALNLGENVFLVEIHILQESMLKSVRAFLIQNNLQDLSEIISIYPENHVIEDDEQFDGSLIYIIRTPSNEEEILTIVNGIADIQSVDIKSISKENISQFMSETKAVAPIQAQKEEQTGSTEKVEAQKLKVQQTIRVDVERLEHLLNLVGELVM